MASNRMWQSWLAPPGPKRRRPSSIISYFPFDLCPTALPGLEPTSVTPRPEKPSPNCLRRPRTGRERPYYPETRTMRKWLSIVLSHRLDMITTSFRMMNTLAQRVAGDPS